MKTKGEKNWTQAELAAWAIAVVMGFAGFLIFLANI